MLSAFTPSFSVAYPKNLRASNGPTRFGSAVTPLPLDLFTHADPSPRFGNVGSNPQTFNIRNITYKFPTYEFPRKGGKRKEPYTHETIAGMDPDRRTKKLKKFQEKVANHPPNHKNHQRWSSNVKALESFIQGLTETSPPVSDTGAPKPTKAQLPQSNKRTQTGPFVGPFYEPIGKSLDLLKGQNGFLAFQEQIKSRYFGQISSVKLCPKTSKVIFEMTPTQLMVHGHKFKHPRVITRELRPKIKDAPEAPYKYAKGKGRNQINARRRPT
jgi:hypothetical protein